MANPFNSKKFRYGGLSVLFVVICIVAVVLVNVIVSVLLDRFGGEVDLTTNSLYTIEDSTVEYLKNVTDNVKIYITSDKTTFENSGTYYKQTLAVVNKIVAANPEHFTLEFVNLLTNPAWASDYGDEIGNGQIVVQSGTTKRFKIITDSDYLDVKCYYNGQEIDESYASYYQYMGYTVSYDVSGASEQCVLSAVMSVTNTDPVKVAVINGYSEVALEKFQTLLSNNAYVLENIDITLVSEISADYDFAVLCWPQTDYNNADILKLENWLSNGGMYGKSLVYLPPLNQTNTPNLDAFLAEWGIQIEKGYLYQTDTNYSQASYPFYMMLQDLDSDYSTAGDYALRCERIRPITLLWEGKGNYTTKTLVSTYDGAVICPFDADESWTPDTAGEKAEYGVIVESSEVRYEGTVATYSKVIAVGTPFLANDTYLSTNGIENGEYLLKIFNTISGKETGITIAPKSFSATSFEINATTSYAIAIVFVIAIPLIVIILGIVVFVRRRYK